MVAAGLGGGVIVRQRLRVAEGGRVHEGDGVGGLGVYCVQEGVGVDVPPEGDGDHEGRVRLPEVCEGARDKVRELMVPRDGVRVRLPGLKVVVGRGVSVRDVEGVRVGLQDRGLGGTVAVHVGVWLTVPPPVVLTVSDTDTEVETVTDQVAGERVRERVGVQETVADGGEGVAVPGHETVTVSVQLQDAVKVRVAVRVCVVDPEGLDGWRRSGRRG